MQNFTPIGKAPVEKSVTVQKRKVNLVSRLYYGMADNYEYLKDYRKGTTAI